MPWKEHHFRWNQEKQKASEDLKDEDSYSDDNMFKDMELIGRDTIKLLMQDDMLDMSMIDRDSVTQK